MKSRKAILNGFLLTLSCLTIILLVRLLKWTGRLTEEATEDFSEDLERMIISMNHPDGGNEWLFVYPHFFRPVHLIKPWLAVRDYPLLLVDRENFYKNVDLNQPVVGRMIKELFIPVDRTRTSDGNYDRSSTFKRCLSELEQGRNLIGFFEGGRTKTGSPDSYKYSERGKKIRKLKKSLGALALRKGVKVKSGWIEFSDSEFPSLPKHGNFSGLRFLKWYGLTLIGRNGRIKLIWSISKDIGEGTKQEATVELENYLLKLGDKV